MQESGPERCERCGGELRRVFFPTGIIFKGSGFYKTDSRSAGSSSSSTTTTKPSTGGDAKPGAGDAGGTTSGGDAGSDGVSGSKPAAKETGKKESA